MYNVDEEEEGKNKSTVSISRTYHDLSNLISEDMLVYTADPQPKFEPQSLHPYCNPSSFEYLSFSFLDIVSFSLLF
jgi:hypothetical protein